MFDLTAQVNAQANSSSLSKLKRDIENQINSISAKVNLTVNSTKLDQLNQRLKELKNYSSQAQSMMDRLDLSVGKLDKSFNSAASGALRLNNSFRNSDLSKVFGDSTTALSAFSEQTALAARRFVAFSVAYQSIGGLASLLKNAVVESISFDRELVRIGQVSEDSFQKVRDLGAEVTRLSKNLGASSSELIKSAVLLKQAGFSVDETKISLEALAKAALAPNFDSLSETTEGLIAVTQQFNIKAKDFESVLGSMNSVAGAFAVEAGDLIEVVKKTGGVFSSIKGDSKDGRDALNELLALFTSVRSTTRESAEQISTGLRTIFGRLQRKETVEALRALGVELRYTKQEIDTLGLDKSLEGQFVGGYEAIKRISQELSKIPATDARFADITEQIGGLRQLSRITPLIKEFGKAQEALIVAQAGSNSLTINAIQAQESLANKIDKVKESWLGLGRSITQDNGFKSIIGQVGILSDLLVKLLDVAKPLIPVLAAFAAKSIVTNFGPNVLGAFTKRSEYPGYRDKLAPYKQAGTDPRDQFLKMDQRTGVGGLTEIANIKDKNQRKEIINSIRQSLIESIGKENPQLSDKDKIKFADDALNKSVNEYRRSVRLDNRSDKARDQAFKFSQEADDIKFNQAPGLQKLINKLTSSVNMNTQSVYAIDDADAISKLKNNNFVKNTKQDFVKQAVDPFLNNNKFILNQTGFFNRQDVSSNLKGSEANLKLAIKNNDQTLIPLYQDRVKVLKALLSELDDNIKGARKAKKEVEREFSYSNYAGQDLFKKEKTTRASSQVSIAESAKLKAEADEIRNRQQTIITTDALDNKKVSLPSAENLAQQDINKNPLAPKVGNQTIKGFIQEQYELSVASKKLTSETLKQVEAIRISEEVEKQYVIGVSKKIRSLNKSISSEESLIIAQEMYQKAMVSGAAVIDKNSRFAANGKGVVFDSGLGSLTKNESFKQSIKDLFREGGLQKGLIGATIASGYLSQSQDDLNQNLRMGGSGLGYSATNSLASGITGATSASLISANPYVIAGAAVTTFASGLMDAQKQIADAKLGIEVQKLADKFRQIRENIVEYNSDTARQLLELQKNIRLGSSESAKFSSPFSYLSGVGSGKQGLMPQVLLGTLTGGISNLGLLSKNSGSEFRRDSFEKQRVELSKTVPQGMQLLIDELKKEFNSNTLRSPESKEGFSKRVLNQTLDANGGVFRELVNNFAAVEGLPVEKVLARFLKVVEGFSKDVESRKFNTETNRIINSFVLIGDAVVAASQELRRFNETTNDISNIMAGKVDVIKATSLSDIIKSSSFSGDAFNKAVGSVSPVFGNKSSFISEQGQIVGALKQNLPTIIASVRAAGVVDEDFSSGVNKQLELKLKNLGFNSSQISQAISIVSSGISKIGDFSKLLEEIGSDSGKISEKIIDPIVKPFTDMLVSVRKELENSANTYIQQLALLASNTAKLNDQLENVDKNRFLLANIRGENQARIRGGLPQDILPLPNIANRAIDRFGNGLNPEQLGDKVRENVDKLNNAQKRFDNAVDQRFEKGGEFKFRQTAQELAKLQSETANSAEALKRLADASQRLSELQEKINFLKDQEQSKFGQAKIQLSGTPQQKRDLRRGQEVFNRIEGGEDIQGLGRREAGLLFGFADQAGPREKNVVNQALRKGGFGLGKEDEENLNKLNKEKEKVAEDALKASQEIAKNMSLLNDVIANRLIKSQDNLIDSIKANTAIIELQSATTKLGINAEKQKELKPGLDALGKVTKIARDFGLDDGSEQKIIDSKMLIKSFVDFKQKQDIQDTFSLKTEPTFFNAMNKVPNKSGIEAISNIVNFAQGNDFLQRRNQIVGDIATKYNFSKEQTEKFVPAFDSPDLAMKIAKSIGVFLGENPILNEKQQKDFAFQKKELQNRGLGELVNQDSGKLKELFDVAEGFSRTNKSISELIISSFNLKEEFNKLSESIKNINERENNRNAVKAAPGLVGGVFEAQGFASGGIVDFRRRGRDRIPAILEPGEAIIPAKSVKENMGIIKEIIRGRKPNLEKMIGAAPIGDTRRFALHANNGNDFDKIMNFGSDLYQSGAKTLNTANYLTSSSSIGRPGIASQRQIEASLLKQQNFMSQDSAVEYEDVFRKNKQLNIFDKNQDIFSRRLNQNINQKNDPRQGFQAVGGGLVSPEIAKLPANLNGFNDKFLQNIDMLNKGFNKFEKNVEILAAALDKNIQIKGDQTISINVTGIPEGKDMDSIKELVVAEMKDQMKKSFPSYV